MLSATAEWMKQGGPIEILKQTFVSVLFERGGEDSALPAKMLLSSGNLDWPSV